MLKFSSQVKELEYESWALAPELDIWLRLIVGGEQNFAHEALKVGPLLPPEPKHRSRVWRVPSSSAPSTSSSQERLLHENLPFAISPSSHVQIRTRGFWSSFSGSHKSDLIVHLGVEVIWGPLFIIFEHWIHLS